MAKGIGIIAWHDKNFNDAINELQNKDFILIYFNEIIKAIFTSLQTGEYYKKELEDKLKSINNDFINKIKIDDEPIENEKEIVSDFLLMYLNFIAYIKNSLDNKFNITSYNFELDHKYKKTEFLYDREYNQAKILFWLFVVNLKIASLDEGYVVSNENIYLLWEMNYLLEKLLVENERINEDIIKPTKLRCNILLYKIVKRKEKSSASSNTYLIYNNNDADTIQSLGDYIKENGGKTIIDKIKNHYFDDTFISPNEFLANFKNKSNEVFVEDILFFTKFFRKQNDLDSEQITEILQITKNLIDKYTKSTNQNNEYIDNTNQYCNITAVDHLENLKLKIEIDQKIASIENNFSYDLLVNSYTEIQNLYTKTVQKPKNSQIPSFIVRKTYVEAIIKLIGVCERQTSDSLNNVEGDFYDILTKIFSDGYKAYYEFVEAVHFWEKQRLIPVYVEIEKRFESEVFLDSYYVLPGEYSKLLEISEQLYINIRNLKPFLLKILPNSIRKENKDFKKDIDTNIKVQQYNAITLIGLFSAFIAFISGNISVLPILIDTSIGATLAFMLIFGVIIFFFIASMKLVFSTNKNFVVWKGKEKDIKINYFLVWALLAIIITVVALRQIEALGTTTISDKTKEKIKTKTEKTPTDKNINIKIYNQTQKTPTDKNINIKIYNQTQKTNTNNQ